VKCVAATKTGVLAIAEFIKKASSKLQRKCDNFVFIANKIV
jgi:hypothetical protein